MRQQCLICEEHGIKKFGVGGKNVCMKHSRGNTPYHKPRRVKKEPTQPTEEKPTEEKEPIEGPTEEKEPTEPTEEKESTEEPTEKEPTEEPIKIEDIDPRCFAADP